MRNFFYFIFLIIIYLGCTKDSGGMSGNTSQPSDPGSSSVIPTNLTLDITLKGQQENPHGDGSGIVYITASADNASYYNFRFENGDSFNSQDGNLTYTFTEPGLNQYLVTVLVFSPTNDYDSISKPILIRVSPPSVDGRDLVWSDEFNYDGPLDSSKWHHQVIPIFGENWANGEQQHYTNRLDNSYVSDGTLKIVAKKEQYIFRGITKNYTSARLNSKYAFKYGRVDVRAKLPSEQGTWPAFWTLGANINEIGNYFGSTYGNVGWPLCGEIDIMEQNGWNKNNLIGHIHWGDTNTGDYGNNGNNIHIQNASSEFNLYSLIWTESSIKILFNNQPFFEVDIVAGMPYNNLHYILLNIAMGGNLGGEIPANFYSSTMELDFVRIYQ